MAALSAELFSFCCAADKKPSILFWNWDKEEVAGRTSSLYVISCLRCSPNKGLLFVGCIPPRKFDYPVGDNGFLQIFEANTGKLLASRQLHLQSITHVEMSVDSGMVVTVSLDRFIKVWLTSRHDFPPR